MAEKMINKIKTLTNGKILVNEPMSKHTTWRIGGPADLLVIPEKINEVQEIVRYAWEEKIPLTVIGNGSNLLVREKGIRGITLKIGPRLGEYSIDGFTIKAEAGLPLAKLVHIASDAGIRGFEFAVGIPASIGGAAVMNAGAHGGAMDQIIREIKVITLAGEIGILSKEKIGYGYRKSNMQNSRDIVVEITYQGSAGNREEIMARTQELLQKRKGMQPLQYPNAGSVFKNPPSEAAGRLIEFTGCKGMKVGGAEVSHQHANFIINTGHATAQDVLNLIEEVRRAVSNKFGINLETEIKVIGE